MGGFSIGGGGIGIPQWTTAGRPSVSGDVLFGFNLTLGMLEYYTGSAWEGLFTSRGRVPVAEFLCVAGGGGSGAGAAGGGGAGGGGGGGVKTGTIAIVSGVQIALTVGAGGSVGPTGTAANGGNGGNSSIDANVCLGGGGGMRNAANGSNLTGLSGGSGGGAGWAGNKPGSGTPGQGYDGGYQYTSSHNTGAGGGGAGGTGETVFFTNTVSKGGPGFMSSISGVSTFYGRGGDGAGYYNSTPLVGVPGAAGTGNGGGASYDNGAPQTGGSGIIILRWPNTFNDPTTVTGSPVVTSIPGFRVYSWTGTGTATFT